MKQELATRDQGREEPQLPPAAATGRERLPRVVGGPRTHGNYRQASFHHVHMIRVQYFDNLICGWAGAWVLPLIGKASHL